MDRKNIDISIAILMTLSDAEYHTITATTLKVGTKFFKLTKKQMNNELADSRKMIPGNSFTNTKMYTQTQLMVTKLRRAKFIQDFPGTKSKGIFSITNKGSILLERNSSERKKIINSEFDKFTNKKKYKK